MSLLAGYFDKRGRHQNHEIVEKIKLFPIVSAGEGTEYHNEIFETKHGHIVLRHKQNYPIKPLTVKDLKDNLLITWGYSFSPLQNGQDKNERKLLNICIDQSADVLQNNEGEFISIFVEGSSGDTHIVNDRFGARHLYFHQTRDCFYFSTNYILLCSMVNESLSLDLLGWLQIFTIEHTIGSRTTFEDISTLLPSTHLLLSSDGFNQKCYWLPEYKVEDDLDPESFADEIFQSLCENTERCSSLVPNGFVTLTGGLDSRLVAGTLPADSNFSALTFNGSMSEKTTTDVKVAATIAEKLGLEHSIIGIPGGELAKFSKDGVNLSGGLVSIHHSFVVMQIINNIKQGAGFRLGGAPGDILSGGGIESRDFLDRGKMQESLDLFCTWYMRSQAESSVLKRFFKEELVHEYQPLVRESIMNGFTNVSGPTPAHRILTWVMSNMLPNFSMRSGISNHPDVTDAMPHFGYQYTDLMLKLPAEWLYQKSFYKYLIYRCLPQLREVIYANTNEALTGDLTPPDDTTVKQDILCRFKAPRHLSRRYKDYHSRLFKIYPFHYALFKSDNQLLVEIEEILHSSPHIKDIINQSACMSFMKGFKRGRPQINYSQDALLLGGLATMCYTFDLLNI